MTTWLPVVAAYLLGSISFSYVIVRLLEGIDIRTVGSGNAGATNVLRAAGRGPAVLALALDVGKGAGAVGLARLLDAAPWVVAAVGVAAVLGHVYPIYFGFRGGKGVATAAGTLVTLVPAVLVAAVLIFALVVVWKRYVSLGSIVAAACFPLLVVAGRALGVVSEEELLPVLLATVAIAGTVIFKHRENIARLLAGTESKLGQKARAPEPAGPTGKAAGEEASR